MIQINKVDRLEKELKESLYKDLKPGDMFLFVFSSVPRLKVDKGHITCCSTRWVLEGSGSEERVNPVDAEINWCYREGAKR